MTGFFSMNFDAFQHPVNLLHIPGYGLFWVSAVPLMVTTIILPMIFGTILHWLRSTKLSIMAKAFVDIALLAVILVEEFYFTDFRGNWYHNSSIGFNGITTWSGVGYAVVYMGFPGLILMLRLSQYFQERKIGTDPRFIDVFKCMAVVDVFAGLSMGLLYWYVWYDGQLVLLCYFWVVLFFCWRIYRVWWSSKL
ncbi:hypothetical protein K440DRAFT_331881 [Wilcoxina mikolae CBS 423.85]|nr:hypothetical protein K440DRAFT_331881 [Wilcoxina mikolae CBS 423.85]